MDDPFPESAAPIGKKSRLTIELVGVLLLSAMAFAVVQYRVSEQGVQIAEMKSTYTEMNRKLDKLIDFQTSVTTLAGRFETINLKLDDIQRQQQIASEVAKYKTQDIWTGTMEVEEVEVLAELLRSLKSDLKKADLPDVRKIQRGNQSNY